MTRTNNCRTEPPRTTGGGGGGEGPLTQRRLPDVPCTKRRGVIRTIALCAEGRAHRHTPTQELHVEVIACESERSVRMTVDLRAR